MVLARFNSVVQDQLGNAVPNASIEVRRETTGFPLVPLFSDRAGTIPMGNPILADAQGTFGFHAEGGAYRIRAYVGDSQTPTFERVWRFVANGTSAETDFETLGQILQAGIVTTQTIADLEAISPEESQNLGGLVLNDPNPSMNGYYTWDDMAMEWVFARGLPDTVAVFEIIGGTPNAITASVGAGVDPANVVLFVISPNEPNTGPVAINSIPTKNVNGDDFQDGEFFGTLILRPVEGEYWAINDAAAAMSAAQSASDAKDEADRAESEADRSDAAADRAENSASSFIEVATNFKTVAALQADETMGYAGSGKDVIVGEGDIATAQGFRYEVAASGATDAHVETAGGVKLYAIAVGGTMTPLQFGAPMNGVDDDSPAANACAEYCCITGTEFRFNAGITRLTETLKFGHSVVTDWSLFVDRTERVNGETIRDVEAYNYNRDNYNICTVSGEPGAIVVADWEPEDPEPVIEYGLYHKSGKVEIRDLNITLPLFIDGGKINKELSIAPRENNLIGLAVYGRVPAIIRNINGFGMGKGTVATINNFTGDVQSCTAWSGGDAFHIGNHNSGSSRSLEAWYCYRGLVCDGDASVFQIQTQQCREDIIFFEGDSPLFLPMYLEDFSPEEEDGEGAFTVTLGTVPNSANRVRFPILQGIRATNSRPGKKAFRFNGVTRGTLIGCREYGNGVESDNVSSATLFETDFVDDQTNLPTARFGRVDQGRFMGPFAAPGGASILRNDVIRVASHAYGSIGAHSSIQRDLTIPEVPGGYTSYVTKVSAVSGGDSRVVLSARLVNATTLRLYISNPTDASLSYGSATHNIELTLFSGGTVVTPPS